MQTESEAQQAAEELGVPVALKVVDDALPHKSEFGLVELGLADAAAVSSAWARLENRLASLNLALQKTNMVVQPMITDGVEVLAGVRIDPSSGPSWPLDLAGLWWSFSVMQFSALFLFTKGTPKR